MKSYYNMCYEDLKYLLYEAEERDASEEEIEEIQAAIDWFQDLYR